MQHNQLFFDHRENLSEKNIAEIKRIIRAIRASKTARIEEITDGLAVVGNNKWHFDLVRTENGAWIFSLGAKEQLEKITTYLNNFSEPTKTISYINKAKKGAAINAFSPLINGAKTSNPNKDKLTNAVATIAKFISENNIKPHIKGPLAYYQVGHYRLQLFKDLLGQWLITPTSQNQILNIYSHVAEKRGEKNAPEIFKKSIGALKLWQWLSFPLLILAGAITRVICSYAIRSAPKLKRVIKTEDRGDKKRRKRALTILVHSSIWSALIPYVGLTHETTERILALAFIVIHLGLFMFTASVIDMLATAATNRATRKNSKKELLLIPILRRAAIIALYISFAFLAATKSGIDVASLMAGLGIGGVMLAFAAKETVENLLGSMTVLLDKPFDVGDWVVIGDTEGTVESIGLRSTRLRTFYCSQINIPNSTLTKSNVDNYGRRPFRRQRFHLSLIYDTSIEKINHFCKEVESAILSQPEANKDDVLVAFNRYGESSLDILVNFYLNTKDLNSEMTARHEILGKISKKAEAAGVEFAFKTITLNIDNKEEGKSPKQTQSELALR